VNGLSVFRLHIEARHGHTDDLSRLCPIFYSTEADFGTITNSRKSDAKIEIEAGHVVWSYCTSTNDLSISRLCYSKIEIRRSGSRPGMVSCHVYERI
jgi:hypothetical protein